MEYNKDSKINKILLTTALVGLTTFIGYRGLKYYLKEHSIKDPLIIKMKELKKKIYSGFACSKSIKFFETKELIIRDSDIDFLVKVVTSLSQKPKYSKDNAVGVSQVKSNPFLPPFDSGVFVDKISQTHSVIFNKYPVFKNHVLIITKEFEEQDSPVTYEDLEASIITMKAIDGFIFFNGGKDAGASQKHKHLQCVPLDSFSYGVISIDEKVKEEHAKNPYEKYMKLSHFKFKHLYYFFDPAFFDDLNSTNLKDKVKEVKALFEILLTKLGNEDRKHAYNLVITKDWMFVVLRKTDVAFEKFNINALGFIASIFLKKEENFRLLNQVGVLNVLNRVSISD